MITASELAALLLIAVLGQAMAGLTDVAMIFVRCRGGISHSPDEYASPTDIGLAIEALIATIVGIAAGSA